MFTYECFWRGKRMTVTALRSYDAQQKAAAIWKVKKPWEITVVLADKPIEPASL